MFVFLVCHFLHYFILQISVLTDSELVCSYKVIIWGAVGQRFGVFTCACFITLFIIATFSVTFSVNNTAKSWAELLKHLDWGWDSFIFSKTAWLHWGSRDRMCWWRSCRFILLKVGLDYESLAPLFLLLPARRLDPSSACFSGSPRYAAPLFVMSAWVGMTISHILMSLLLCWEKKSCTSFGRGLGTREWNSFRSREEQGATSLPETKDQHNRKA